MKHEAISPNKAEETKVEGGEHATAGAFLDALKKVQAVIEYAPDGAILTASGAFLKATGYTMRDIKGKPQKVLCDAAYAESDAFADLWARLGKGEAASGEFTRVAKGGGGIARQRRALPHGRRRWNCRESGGDRNFPAKGSGAQRVGPG